MRTMYQPNIENTGTERKPNLAELFNTPEVQKDYQELASRKERQSMENVYDRPIVVLSFDTVDEKTNFGGKDEIKTFTRIHFKYLEDPESLDHYCLTQAIGLKTALESIGNDRLKQFGGVNTMICKKQYGAKKSIYFDGLENI